jgi:drug/metabolite transporter (DMT)-like permease
VFCLSQAFRDVYFAGVFQGVDFFAVLFLAALLSMVIFCILTAVRAPGEFAKLRREWRTVAAMNITTACAWPFYFYGLTHLEPSIVNTLHSGIAPIAVAILGTLGVRLAKPGRIGRKEAACYGGIALSLAALWWVVLSGRSGLALASFGTTLSALALLIVSGTSITISLLYSKRLNDRGISASAVTGVRYLLLILLGAGIEIGRGGTHGISGAPELAILAVAATALMVVPTYILQAGVARSAPLTAQVIRALGPVFVFALEQIDQRVSYSTPVLVCILAYSAFTVGGNLAHGWRDRPPIPVADGLRNLA